jgi:hypothetical protein
MSSRALLGILVALAVVVALGLAISVSEHSPAAGSTMLLYPQLKAKLNDVDKLSVRSAGDHTVATIERGKSGWTVAERHAYPADIGKLRKLLIALADAKLLEEKTSQPDFYSKLGVSDIDQAGGNGVRVDIAAGKDSFGLIVGNVAAGEQTYVRRAGEKASWLVSGSISVPKETNDWLDRTIISLQTARVHRAIITQPEGAMLRVEKAKPDAANFDVLDVPSGRQISFAGVGTSVASALSDATLDNVIPAAEFNAADVKPVLARFETFDGLAVEARVYKAKEGTRVVFSAQSDPALVATPPAKPADSKQADAKPAAATPAKSLGEVKSEADELNARFSKWVYVLAEFKVEQLTKKLDDMLQPLPAKPTLDRKPIRTKPGPLKTE